VVFSSGYTMDKDSDQLLASGARAFIPKPYRPDDLIRTVRQVLDSHPCRRPSSVISTAASGFNPG
jgi:CheY-like chemotaxis protein